MVLDEMNRELCLDIRRDIRQILFVVSWKDDGSNPCPVSCQKFFLNAADRQNLSAKRDLSRHCDIATHRNSSQRADQRCRHRDAGRRAVLRNRAFRYVDVQVQMTVEIFGNSKQVRSRPHITHCGLGGFLHDFAQLSGQRQLALARHQRCFSGKDFAAHFGPRQPGDETHFVLLFEAVRTVLRNTDVFSHILSV